jgi:hypothetical protein
MCGFGTDIEEKELTDDSDEEGNPPLPAEVFLL